MLMPPRSATPAPLILQRRKRSAPLPANMCNLQAVRADGNEVAAARRPRPRDPWLTWAAAGRTVTPTDPDAPLVYANWPRLLVQDSWISWCARRVLSLHAGRDVIAGNCGKRVQNDLRHCRRLLRGTALVTLNWLPSGS